LLAGVFLLGSVAGAGAARAYILNDLHSRFGGPPAEVRAHLRIEAMRRQIDLSDEQVAKIEAIFQETDGDFERSMKPCRDNLDQVRARTDERIAEVLTPEQRKRFQEYVEKRKRMRGGPFPSPPSGPGPR
jgi:Spy/CpxP family protein refolding chaperone